MKNIGAGVGSVESFRRVASNASDASNASPLFQKPAAEVTLDDVLDDLPRREGRVVATFDSAGTSAPVRGRPGRRVPLAAPPSRIRHRRGRGRLVRLARGLGEPGGPGARPVPAGRGRWARDARHRGRHAGESLPLARGARRGLPLEPGAGLPPVQRSALVARRRRRGSLCHLRATGGTRGGPMMRPDDLAWSDVGEWPSTGDVAPSVTCAGCGRRVSPAGIPGDGLCWGCWARVHKTTTTPAAPGAASPRTSGTEET